MTDEGLIIIDEIELSASTVSLKEDGIFHVVLKSIDRELTEKDIRELTESIGIIGKRAKYPVLILVREFNDITKSASEYAASEIAGRYTSAYAIVVNSEGIRIGLNIFIKMFKLARPTKMFISEKNALEWLKKFL